MYPRLVSLALLTPLLWVDAGAQEARGPRRDGDDDLGEVPRNALLVFPTRLANVYFPELTFGYRRRLGASGLYALGIAGGPTFDEEPSPRSLLGKIWGFGVAVEARRYWFDSPSPRVDPFFVVGGEVSRAYYDSYRSLRPVGGEAYSRVAEGRSVSRRNEVLGGIGAEFTAASGIVVDVRLAVAAFVVSYDVLEGELAPAQQNPFWRQPHHTSTQLLFDAREAFVQPRMRIGLGWRW